MADDRPELSTPILIVGCRRPDTLARVFRRVREARPARLFIAFDVPATGPDDPEHRRAVEAASVVDWSCAVEIDIAEHPLGPSGRIVSAIDSAFESVDRLIVLEDDILVDPSFFPWAEAMLDRYADDPLIGHIGGRNELVRWPGDEDHLLVRRGSMWGWATWRDRWLRHRDGPRPAAPLGDTLLDEHTRLMDRAGDGPLAWDLDWSRYRVASDLQSVIPRVNLVDNIGFGADATHTFDPQDLRADFPIGDAATGSGPLTADPVASVPHYANDVYDEWSLLVELMTTFRHPDAVARLARLDARRQVPLLDDAARHHLAPFRRADSSLRALAHLRRHGIDPGRLAPLEHALRRVVTAGTPS
ncbi:MAG: hypothetical protein ACKOIA_11615 [Acidimicrobiia bacterium]